MWLFTRYGFFSIACAHGQNGEIDPGTVMIRARRKEHLERLRERFPKLAAVEVTTTPDSDYRYRLIVPKADWVSAAGELCAEQTWTNFKKEAARFQGKPGAAYVHALHDVWTVMYDLQNTE